MAATSTEVTAWPHLYAPAGGMPPCCSCCTGRGSNERDIASLAGSQILAFNGDVDAMAPLVSVNRLIAELKLRGATVKQVLRPGGHGIKPGDLETARDGLARNR